LHVVPVAYGSAAAALAFLAEVTCPLQLFKN
jgi:hypothetical protein